MVDRMLDWVANLPLWQATLFLFGVVFFRAQATFWIGKMMHRGFISTKWGKKNAADPTAILALEKFGWPVIPLSFLTVGLQSVVQIGAGLLDWNWFKYTVAAIPGYLAWGFIYAFGGLALFHSIVNGSIGLLFMAIILIVIFWFGGYYFLKRLKAE